jgi:hypothetical protein
MEGSKKKNEELQEDINVIKAKSTTLNIVSVKSRRVRRNSAKYKKHYWKKSINYYKKKTKLTR